MAMRVRSNGVRRSERARSRVASSLASSRASGRASGLAASLALLGALALGPVARADSPAGAKAPENPLASPSGDPLAPSPGTRGTPGTLSAVESLAVLREVGRVWTYEKVQGESLAKLGRLPNVRENPRVRCKVVAWTVPAPLTGARLECAELGAPGGPAGPTWSRHLVFDSAGVRELAAETDLTDRSRTGGITFPRALDGKWKLDERGAGGRRTQVILREETAPVRGASERLWVAETTKWPPPGPSPKAPELEIVRYLPGTGPVLLCTKTTPESLYQCLRLVEDPPPARRGPAERISISSQQAHDSSSLKAATVATKILSTYGPGVRRCYQAMLAKQPGARASLTIELTVNAVGKVEDLSVTGSDRGLAACVKATTSSWRFPIPMSSYAEPRAAQFSIGLALSPG